MRNVLRMGRLDVIPPNVGRVFGSDTDSMQDIEARARATFPGAIVWECNPTTFGFTYVGSEAKRLGHAVERWFERGFWAKMIVHEDDRQDAVDYCVLATSKCIDHVFEYRAVHADGHVIWLRDIVRVVFKEPRRPELLRGLMIDVPHQDQASAVRLPTREELMALR